MRFTGIDYDSTASLMGPQNLGIYHMQRGKEYSFAMIIFFFYSTILTPSPIRPVRYGTYVQIRLLSHPIVFCPLTGPENSVSAFFAFPSLVCTYFRTRFFLS
ncbi:hypothetical protein GE21DRAFT_1014396 [Neurospora crassa]|nr:hypothetical protein GE21DRAFT_1014396 [Neurospora crassa]